ITGADLLEQYAYLNLGFSLYVLCDDPASENPTQSDLGIKSHLYAKIED
ncbi:TPA: phage baseplate plug family protein, partial [Klebsiella pneumoniae]